MRKTKKYPEFFLCLVCFGGDCESSSLLLRLRFMTSSDRPVWHLTLSTSFFFTFDFNKIRIPNTFDLGATSWQSSALVVALTALARPSEVKCHMRGTIPTCIYIPPHPLNNNYLGRLRGPPVLGRAHKRRKGVHTEQGGVGG